ncbi:hypothetical protein NDU88_007057 [Pleurodeles waltl]|uniref:Uncharacterized protein n=1 Tax=Pleurodeles waltl TaxID=8319 RepID=A0AAV7PK71_PLEWA|nr:hypothetical protein NDU88_007057 [Pleurodeles waltl]
MGAPPRKPPPAATGPTQLRRRTRGAEQASPPPARHQCATGGKANPGRRLPEAKKRKNLWRSAAQQDRREPPPSSTHHKPLASGRQKSPPPSTCSNTRKPVQAGRVSPCGPDTSQATTVARPKARPQPGPGTDKDTSPNQVSPGRGERYSRCCVRINAVKSPKSGRASLSDVHLAGRLAPSPSWWESSVIKQLQEEILRLREKLYCQGSGDGSQQHLNLNVQILHTKLREATRIARLSQEKEQLIDLGNRLRAELVSAGREGLPKGKFCCPGLADEHDLDTGTCPYSTLYPHGRVVKATTVIYRSLLQQSKVNIVPLVMPWE